MRAGLLALALTVPALGAAEARTTPYDGTWNITIVTQRGTCDRYNFPVEIQNGQVMFPGLVRAGGRVGGNGAVSVSIKVMDKSAAGSGRLTLGAGSGRWSGKSGNDRCSGTWTAQRN
ncbi:MAG: hypothetical protein FJW24_10995 [Acidimicrobiia bacterium]|nr:hypothetical protein [Acidimicrobiia bacterium]